MHLINRVAWWGVVGALVGSGAGGDEGGVRLTVINDAPAVRHEVVRISVPLPRGALAGKPSNLLYPEAAEPPAAGQARALTRHPEGSIRRLLLKVPLHVPPGVSTYTYQAHGGRQTPAGRCQTDSRGGTLAAQPYRVAIRDDLLQILGKEGSVLALVRAYGPALEEPQPATVEILEAGPIYLWSRWRQAGTNYTREVDLEVDCRGRIQLTQRILRHQRDDVPTPDFGFDLSAPAAQGIRLPAEPVHFLDFAPESSFTAHPDLVASLRLSDGTLLSMANPLALRQNRGALATSAEGDRLILHASRIQPVTEENNYLVIQEGAWRILKLVIQPGPPEELATALDHPLEVKLNWEAYHAVFHSGPPLQVEHPVLQRLSEAYLQTIQSLSRNGDDWGTMGGLDRYNHCHYVWYDYFRTGDPRLRQVALDWSENYMNFSVYWGPGEKYYGGGRYPGDRSKQPWPGTFKSRYNNGVSFCTKGYHSFWLAYEETGDPRFRYAAEQQARWAAAKVHCPGEMRNIGVVDDYVKLYEYTGEQFYLDQAVRLWEEFQTRQAEDLLFTQSGRPPTGNHLYIWDDEYGYQHPFYKSYIVQYATNSLPYLLPHRPSDQRLRDTIIACNDWMAQVQTPAGGWSYPGPTTGGLGWNNEYCHGLMRGYEIEPREAYLDAIQRDLRALVALFDRYGAIPNGIQAWESVAGIPLEELKKRYHLGSDRDRMKDFTAGRLSFGCGPDQAVYFCVLLRDYLKYRAEASLFVVDEILNLVLQLPR